MVPIPEEEDKNVFEFEESDQVLNLDFYIHRSIMRWQDALEKAIIQGKIEDGLVARGLAAEMVCGCATAKKLIHWEKQDVPEEKDDKKKQKKREKIIKENEEAEDFQKRFKDFKSEMEKQNINNKNIKEVKIADFKVYEVLKRINIGASKKGKVII